MRICGIVAEYNPFHKGHAYQIDRTREELGDDCAIVCCMSGDFVQRGDAAILPKHLRAQAAVESGADVVLELSTPYALRSAEGFADSAVQILFGTGVLTDLSFGAEDANPQLLMDTAALLLEHRTVQDTLQHLKTGISYAAARERALYQRVQEQAEIIKKPNNILAIEYCKALLRHDIHVQIHPIRREGAGHDEGVSGEYASASYIRERFLQNDFSGGSAYLPAGCAELIRTAFQNGSMLLDRSRLENAMMDRLVRLSIHDLLQLPDADEGLSNRILEAIRRSRSIDEICALVKTKRYAYARIRRMIFCAYLGLTARDTVTSPPYARVLAFNDKGREVLKAARKQTILPLITKPAHAFDLGGTARDIFEKEALACDLYHLALPNWKQTPWGADWRQDALYIR